MLTRSRLISDASAIAGGPANSPLPDGVPESLRFTTASELEVELCRDLALSPEMRLVSSTPIQLQVENQDFTLPAGDLEAATYVSVSTADGQPRDVDITNLSQLNINRQEGRLAVGFYGERPQRGRVSWIPTGTETLTVWYDRSPQTDPSPDQATFTITDSYLPLLKLMLAAQMLEFTGKTVGPVLAARISRGLKQWLKFVDRNRQSGVVEKSSWSPKSQQGPGIWSSEFPVR